MSPTDSVKLAKKLRGFTLIELIIVMAIIAILAGIMSLAIGGFQRDAKIEAANNEAQIAYTGFQNILVRCEINQDIDLFNIRKIVAPSSTDKPTYCVVAFEMANGTVVGGQYILTTMYNAAATKTVKQERSVMNLRCLSQYGRLSLNLRTPRLNSQPKPTDTEKVQVIINEFKAFLQR